MNKARFKDCGLAYILCFAFIFGVSIILSGIMSYIVINEGTDINEVINRPWITYLSSILSEIIFVLVFIIIVLVSKNKKFKSAYRLSYKFDYKILLTSIFLGVFVMLCSVNITDAINIGFSYLSPLSLSNDFGFPIDNFGQYLIAVLVLAVLPSICEELVFRGVIFNGLRQKFSTFISIILSSLMFMLIHMSVYKSFYQVILGVITSLFLCYTGTIFYGIIFHFINNFTIVTINYVSKGNTIFEFLYFGVKEVLLSILIFCIAVAVVFVIFKYLSRYTKKHKNYFNLETTNMPLQQFNTNIEELSYEQRLIVDSKKNEGLALFLISISLAVVLWSFNSFGGFI